MQYYPPERFLFAVVYCYPALARRSLKLLLSFEVRRSLVAHFVSLGVEKNVPH